MCKFETRLVNLTSSLCPSHTDSHPQTLAPSPSHTPSLSPCAPPTPTLTHTSIAMSDATQLLLLPGTRLSPPLHHPSIPLLTLSRVDLSVKPPVQPQSSDSPSLPDRGTSSTASPSGATLERYQGVPRCPLSVGVTVQVGRGSLWRKPGTRTVAWVIQGRTQTLTSTGIPSHSGVMCIAAERADLTGKLRNRRM